MSEALSTSSRTIKWEEFVTKYKPKKNEVSKDASFDGYMFETYGEDYEAISDACQENKKSVWTIVESEGVMLVIPGPHLVNRLGYILTENNWEHECLEVVGA